MTEPGEAADGVVDAAAAPNPTTPRSRMPAWTWKAIALFWIGYLVAQFTQDSLHRVWSLFVVVLVSFFLALAIEPGVNRLAQRGWRRGTATALILLGVTIAFILFVVAIASLVGQQIADLLSNSDTYVNKTVDFLNDTFSTNIDAQQVIDWINDADGPVQHFIDRQQSKVWELSLTALGFVVQFLTVLLFTFYLVADGPKMRRSICSRLRPERQRQLLRAWDVAIEKTGGYLYSRALLAGLSSVFHGVALAAVGTRAPLALALWVGLMSQFLPVIGTYLAGALPVLITFIDSPFKALIVLVIVILYQQVENYLLLPRITARAMDFHPAVAFGSALAGALLLGGVGAVLAIPAAAMAQALLKDMGARHPVVESPLTGVAAPRPARQRRWRKRSPSGPDPTG